MAYTNSAPSPLQIATTNNYISSTDFLNGMDGIIDADRGEMLVERYGSQNLTGLMEMLGNKAPVDSTTFYHYEEDWLHSKVSLTASSAVTTIGAPVTLTVANADMILEGVDDPAVDAIHPIREHDILQAADGTVLLVTDISDSDTGPSITAELVSGASAASAVTFAITGNAYPEGSDQPSGLTPGLSEYKNYVQIMKEAYEVTGSALTEKIWFEVEDPATGRTGYLWALKGEGDTFRRFNNYCETQMITGIGRGPNNASGAMTEGLEAFAKSGNTADYTYGQDGVITAIELIIDTLEDNRGAKENLFIMGHNMAMNFDADLSINDRFVNGGISYGAFNGSQEVATGFGIDSFYRGGYTFHKMKYAPFSYPELLGAIGYKDKGCVIPMDEQRDASTRSSIPSLRIRYKAAEGYSREMEHWMEGGAGLDVKTNGLDVLKLNYRTERGFEGFASNRFVWVDKATA